MVISGLLGGDPLHEAFVVEDVAACGNFPDFDVLRKVIHADNTIGKLKLVYFLAIFE